MAEVNNEQLYEKMKRFLINLYGDKSEANLDYEKAMKYFEIRCTIGNKLIPAFYSSRAYINKTEQHYNLELDTTVSLLKDSLDRCKKYNKTADYTPLQTLIAEHEKIKARPVGEKLDRLNAMMAANRHVTAGGPNA